MGKSKYLTHVDAIWVRPTQRLELLLSPPSTEELLTSRNMNFIEKVLNGLEFSDAIDDYIEDWNDSETVDELHEFLGFTWNEYALWCEEPSSLRAILASRKHHAKIDANEWEGVHLLAARAQSQQDPEILKDWLTKKGLL